jgi:alcohol dehydrogenase class IV
MQFEFATANRIIFGSGKICEIGEIAKQEGSNALVVCGSSIDRYSTLNSSLVDHGINYFSYSVNSEPTTDIVRNGIELCRQERCDLVIGIGGGSVIDTGKAIALLSANEGDVYDYLEVVGQGKEISTPGISMIAIPTTAGTGSEVTRNAVIGIEDHKLKVSLRSQFMLPRVALIDPELSTSMPPKVTASTGMDAMTQLIEPYVSNQANPITDAFCQEGLKHAATSIREVYHNGTDIEARGKMSLASLFSGFALANAKLGAVHGFAGVLGGIYAAPHGEICASLMPAVLKVNIRALQKKKSKSDYLSRYERIAQTLTGKHDSNAGDAVEFIEQLNSELKIPPLSQFGVLEADYPEIIVKAASSSSMKGNPVTLTPDEMYMILELSQ